MENAELYSSANGMQKKDARDVLTEFGSRINWRRGSRILDVGCGSGEVTTEIILPQLPKDFRELIGLDVSLDMIRHARNFHSRLNVKFVQFDISRSTDDVLEAIAETTGASKTNDSDQRVVEPEVRNQRLCVRGLENPDTRRRRTSSSISPFDVVFSFYCLHWVPDQRLALRNIYKCLRPGGEALLVFLVRSPIFTLYRQMAKCTLWKRYMKDVNDFIPLYQDSERPKEIFNEIIKSTGFCTIKLDCMDKSYIFDSFSSLRSAIAAVNPFLSRIPKSLQEEYIDDCLYQTEIMNLATLKNGCYRVSYRLMVAHIQKPQ